MLDELVENSEKILDVGSGDDPVPGAVTIDISDSGNPDYQHDITVIPWPDSIGYEYDLIVLKDVVEHLPTDPVFLNDFFQELESRLAENGRVYIRVPHYTSPEASGDIQHTRTGYSSDFHMAYVLTSLQVVEKNLAFARRKKLPWNYLVEHVANISPWFYEHTPLSIFPAKNMEILLGDQK